MNGGGSVCDMRRRVCPQLAVSFLTGALLLLAAGARGQTAGEEALVAEVVRLEAGGAESALVVFFSRLDPVQRVEIALRTADVSDSLLSFERLLTLAVEQPDRALPARARTMAARLHDDDGWCDALRRRLPQLGAAEALLAAQILVDAGGQAARELLSLALSERNVALLEPCLDRMKVEEIADSQLPRLAELCADEDQPLHSRIKAARALGRCGRRALEPLYAAYREVYAHAEQRPALRTLRHELHRQLVALNGQHDRGTSPEAWAPRPARPPETEPDPAALDWIGWGALAGLLAAMLALAAGLRRKLLLCLCASAAGALALAVAAVELVSSGRYGEPLPAGLWAGGTLILLLNGRLLSRMRPQLGRRPSSAKRALKPSAAPRPLNHAVRSLGSLLRGAETRRMKPVPADELLSPLAERRQGPRLVVKRPLWYQPAAASADSTAPAGVAQGELLDISRTGLRFQAPQPVERGGLLWIFVHQDDGSTFRALTRVVWCTGWKNATHEIGLEIYTPLQSEAGERSESGHQSSG